MKKNENVGSLVGYDGLDLETEMPMIRNYDNSPDDIRQKLQDLKPIDNLEFDNIAERLAKVKDNPEKYSGIITGFFKQWKLDKEIKAVGMFNDYLEKIRLASNSAAELQQTLIKNRIIFIFQVQFAQERLQKDWAEEKGGYEERKIMRNLRIAKAKSFIKFYKEIDLKNLSETALILLNMTTERASTSSFNTLDSSSSTSVQYGSPEEILRIKKEEKLMEILMGEQLANINLKNTQVEEARIKTKHQEWKNERERNRPRE